MSHDDNLDLDAYGRFLIHALEQADKDTRARAAQLLGHGKKGDSERDQQLSDAHDRISRLASEAEHQRQRAKRAEDEAEKQKQRAQRAEAQAHDHQHRLKEISGIAGVGKGG